MFESFIRLPVVALWLLCCFSGTTLAATASGIKATGNTQNTQWRFAVVGDTHVPASSIVSEIAASMLADGVKLALFAGDIAESGAGASASTYATQLATWKNGIAALYNAGIGVYPIRGNHESDVKNVSIEAWNTAFSGIHLLPANGPAGETNLTYSFAYKNALFIGLDEYVSKHRVNQPWLEQQLASKQTRPHLFVFGHEPAFKVFHSDTLDDYVSERDTFWKSLAEAGGRTYFSGHDHFFDLARIDDGDGNPNDDLYQLVVGTGGGELFSQYNYFNNSTNSTYTPTQLAHLMANGYLLVEVSGETDNDLGVTLTFKQRTLAANGTVSYEPAYTFSYSANAKASSATPTYAIVDTGQTATYNASTEIAAPAAGAAFFGQDAQHQGLAPSYRDNGDGTISDLNSGLMWVKARGSKTTWALASSGAASSRVGGYADWRMPTIKELYSLIQFTGVQGPSMTSTAGYIPFIDSSTFDFVYGAGSSTVGERVIDSQDWSANLYVGKIMNNQSAAFGLNFADGRIKGYPVTSSNYVRYVRENSSYGVNAFKDNGDGTVSDNATRLMWTQADSGVGLDWQAALAWAQTKNAEFYLGHNDWRLPNAKELQSLVDYSRAPLATDTTQRGAAIDPIFSCTAIVNEGGEPDYPFYWSSTSFKDGTRDGVPAAYVTFGRALGYMKLNGSSTYQLLDVHGAGTQRSDPKAGNVSDYLLGNNANGQPVYGRGPQGDVVRIANFVRLVRDEPSASTTQQTLSVVLSGNGVNNKSGNIASTPAGIDCGTTCSASFPNGSSVSLTPTPTSGYYFAGWSGDCAASNTGLCTLSMDGAKNVGASFRLLSTPEAPVIIAAQPGPGSMSLSFAAAQDNGSPITGYTASCTSPGQPTRSASASSSPITVRNLLAGAGYSCSLSAHNSLGNSPQTVLAGLVPKRSSPLNALLLLLLN
jgi:hypothetical protein